MVKFSLYSKLVLVISTLYRSEKLLEHFILIAVALLLRCSFLAPYFDICVRFRNSRVMTSDMKRLKIRGKFFVYQEYKL